MKTTTITTALMLMLGMHLFAQKGTGNNQGVVREYANSEIIMLKGIVSEVKDETCANTTGRYTEGRHLIISTQEQNSRILNIHLGPKAVVTKLIKSLTEGNLVSIKAFATEDLPKNQFIAQSITLDNKTYHLRNSDLSPVWSNQNQTNRKGRRNWRR